MATREQTQATLDLLSAGVMKHTPEQTYTLADRLEEHATLAPHRPFLIWKDRTLSYAEVNRQANHYAHFAHAQGLRQGDVAALLMENRPEFLFALFGLAKIGCVTALINNQISGDALHHALAITGSTRLIIGAECLERLEHAPEIPKRLPTYVVTDGEARKISAPYTVIDHALATTASENPPKTLRSEVRGASTLCLVFTSGTTGLPKAARLTHARWLGVGEGWSRLLGLGPEDVFYCVLPLYHVAALMSLLSNAITCGGSVVLRARFSASHFWPDVRKYGVTVAQYSGEMCRYLFNQVPQADDREHRLRIMTGSGLSPTIWQAFQDRFGITQMIEGYGGTEINVGMMNVDNRIGSCGRIPFKEKSNARLVRYDRENDCYIRDAEGHLIECGPDEVGELVGMILKLPGITGGRFDGYTDPDATERKILRDAFRPGDAWLRTGDMFTRDADDYYYFVDRVGDTFRWKSENVSTTEVANVLGRYAELETVTVYGVAIAQQEGRAGMATVVMQAGRRFDPVAFYKLASEHLPRYAVPVFVRVRTAVDITSTFKLRKVDLQTLGYAASGSDDLYVADTTAGAYIGLNAENLSRLGIPAATD